MTDPSKPAGSQNAIGLLFFFTFLNIINFVDRNLIIGFSPAIMEDLQLSQMQYGLLTGIVFTVFYTFVGVILGMMADRFNRPRLIAVGLFVWSLMTAASGAARNFVHMGVARLFVGAGEATLTPTALSLLSDVFPPQRRAMASGVYYMGVPLGTAAGLIVAGLLGPFLGWRNSFYIMGVVGILLVVPVLMIKDPPRGAMETADLSGIEAHASFRAIIGDLLRAMRISPAFMWTVTGGILTHIGLAATLFDIQWLVAERGFTRSSAPLIAGSLYALAGILGTAGGGALADWCHQRWSGGKLWFLVVIGLGAVPFGIAYRFVDSSHWFFYVCLFVGSVALTAFYGPVFSAVQDLAPARVRSTSIAFLLFMVNMIGIGGGAFLIGALIDTLAAQGYEQPMTYGILAGALVGMLSSFAYLFGAITYRSSLERVAARGPKSAEPFLPE